MTTAQPTNTPPSAPNTLKAADAAGGYNPPAPVPAGGATAAAVIAQVLSSILAQIDFTREIAIAISNLTDNDLVNPSYYIESGKIENPPLVVSSNQANFIAASKTSGAAVGSVGIVSYEIKNTEYRLVVLWSVPFSYASYSNVFNFNIVSKSKPIDADLYNKMYSNAVEATDGTYSVKDSGFKIKGVMGNGGQATLTLQIKVDNS